MASLVILEVKNGYAQFQLKQTNVTSFSCAPQKGLNAENFAPALERSDLDIVFCRAEALINFSDPRGLTYLDAD